jgi:hypothetical protein
MASVTVARIAGVQADVADALNRTSPASILPKAEQHSLLGQGCVEACDLLTDWLASPGWDGLRPKHDGPIASWIPERENLKKFLDPRLKDTLARADQGRNCVDTSLVDRAYEAVRDTARRYPRMKSQDLFLVARKRVEALQQEVCALATRLKGQAHTAETWRKARKALKKVEEVLLAVVLAIVAAGPQAALGPSEWIHEAVNVVVVHQIAHSAQPNLRVAPPRAGPRPR